MLLAYDPTPRKHFQGGEAAGCVQPKRGVGGYGDLRRNSPVMSSSSSSATVLEASAVTAPRWTAWVIFALVAQLWRVLAMRRAEYFEPDAFSIERPFIGDDLFGGDARP